MDSLKKKLGARIQYLRKQQKLTQEAMAEKVGMDTPNLSNIECGKRFMTAETLEKIALALNTTERELFNFSYTEPQKYMRADIDELLNKADDDDLLFFSQVIKSYFKRKEKI